jgi:hypothetical protein
MPWWHDGAWMTDPALAYLKGLQDGAQLGREQADAELVAAMASALSDSATDDYADAVDIYHRRIDQRRRREAVDADAGRVRPGDYLGEVA